MFLRILRTPQSALTIGFQDSKLDDSEPLVSVNGCFPGFCKGSGPDIQRCHTQVSGSRCAAIVTRTPEFMVRSRSQRHPPRSAQGRCQESRRRHHSHISHRPRGGIQRRRACSWGTLAALACRDTPRDTGAGNPCAGACGSAGTVRAISRHRFPGGAPQGRCCIRQERLHRHL